MKLVKYRGIGRIPDPLSKSRRIWLNPVETDKISSTLVKCRRYWSKPVDNGQIPQTSAKHRRHRPGEPNRRIDGRRHWSNTLRHWSNTVDTGQIPQKPMPRDRPARAAASTDAATGRCSPPPPPFPAHGFRGVCLPSKLVKCRETGQIPGDLVKPAASASPAPGKPVPITAAAPARSATRRQRRRWSNLVETSQISQIPVKFRRYWSNPVDTGQIL